MKVKIGKKGICYISGGAALAAIVAFSCGKAKDSVVGDPTVIKTAYVVSSVRGAEVTISGDQSVTVQPGETTSFDVTAASGSTLSTTVGGTCPAGTWSGSTYTVGTPTDDCLVVFETTDTPTTTALTLSADHTTSITVTPVTAGERQILYPVATVLAKHSGSTATSTPSYTVSSTVGGTCAAGTWNSDQTQYYTGAVTEACTVIFTINNPCGDLSGQTANWTNVQALMNDATGAGANVNLGGYTSQGKTGCVACHSGASGTKGLFGPTAAGTPVVYATVITPTCSVGGDTVFPCNSTNNTNYPSETSGKAIKAYDPLNSWIYRKVSASSDGTTSTGVWLGGARMPFGCTSTATSTSVACWTATQQAIMCNWIWNGASQ